jgi:hypothetical protein
VHALSAGDTLVVTLSSLVADEALLAVVLRDLAAFLSGGAAAEDPLQYADFSEWEHEQLTAADAAAEVARRLAARGGRAASADPVRARDAEWLCQHVRADRSAERRARGRGRRGGLALRHPAARARAGGLARAVYNEAFARWPTAKIAVCQNSPGAAKTIAHRRHLVPRPI